MVPDPGSKKQKLFQHIKHGGLSVPSLASSNIAAILEPSYVLWHHSSFYRWAQIENETLPYGSVKDLLAISQLHKPPNFKLLTLSHLFTAWYKYVIWKKWVFVSRDVIPVTSLQTWIPHLPLSNWLAKGITTVSQFYSGDYVLPYGTLSSTYNLPKSLFYQYLQIRHALQAISWPLKSTISSFFQTHLFGSSGSKGGLSKIYNMLLDVSVYSTSEHHSRWEQELSAHFSTLEWERASTTPLKLGVSTILK